MKLPGHMNKIKKLQSKDIDSVVKSNADIQHWQTKEPKAVKPVSVSVSLRMDSDLKEILERKARVNKVNRSFPNSLTDFIIQAVSEYVERNKEYLKEE